MWLVTEKGFLSVVKHDTKPGILIVRSRFHGQVSEIFGVKEKFTPDHDYPYRAEIKAEKAGRIIGKLLSEIEYTNFKERVAKNIADGEIDCIGPFYSDLCHDIYVDAVVSSLKEGIY